MKPKTDPPVSLSKPPAAELARSRHEALLDRLDELHRAVLNPRPVEVRHVHEQPPKAQSVTVQIQSPRGEVMNITLMNGSSWDLPPHFLVGEPQAELAPRRWWQRPRAVLTTPLPTMARPAQIRIVDMR